MPFHAHLGCTVRTKILSMWIYIYIYCKSLYLSVYLSTYIYTHINQFTLQIMLPKVIHEIKKVMRVHMDVGVFVCVCESMSSLQKLSCLVCRTAVIVKWG